MYQVSKDGVGAHSVRFYPAEMEAKRDGQDDIGSHLFSDDNNLVACPDTWRTWHLIPTGKCVFEPPKPKESPLDIPGRHGELELNRYIHGHPVFGNRTGSLEFILDPDYTGSWASLYRRIVSYFQGKERLAVLSDDRAFFYKGRFHVSDIKPGEYWDTLRIDYNLDPFKYDRWYGKIYTIHYKGAGVRFSIPAYVMVTNGSEAYETGTHTNVFFAGGTSITENEPTEGTVLTLAAGQILSLKSEPTAPLGQDPCAEADASQASLRLANEGNAQYNGATIFIDQGPGLFYFPDGVEKLTPTDATVTTDGSETYETGNKTNVRLAGEASITENALQQGRRYKLAAGQTLALKSFPEVTSGQEFSASPAAGQASLLLANEGNDQYNGATIFIAHGPGLFHFPAEWSDGNKSQMDRLWAVYERVETMKAIAADRTKDKKDQDNDDFLLEDCAVGHSTPTGVMYVELLTASLSTALNGLVNDGSGQVNDGCEERVAAIVGGFSSSLNIKIEIAGGVIQDYSQIKDRVGPIPRTITPYEDCYVTPEFKMIPTPGTTFKAQASTDGGVTWKGVHYDTWQTNISMQRLCRTFLVQGDGTLCIRWRGGWL